MGEAQVEPGRQEIVYPEEAPRTQKENPWFAVHLNAEMDYTGSGYSRQMARRRVEQEYMVCPDPVPCPCGEGQKRWYRVTVGAMQCPSCRGLTLMDGRMVE